MEGRVVGEGRGGEGEAWREREKDGGWDGSEGGMSRGGFKALPTSPTVE